MKIAHAESNVLETGGLTSAPQSFKIQASAHAFRMLSSGLYSDKVSAVLREIGCNAHDAHIDAGIAHKPIEVKLPNAIDPQFYIRDFGKGLSEEAVFNLYTTYFASTKQNSNDFTGAFGLGSKSPFSYTDSFTIEACHGGMKRVFSAHIGDQGSPNIVKMTEVETDQTGLTIGFPVKSSDFSEFAEKAQLVYQFFSVPPEIKGGKAIVPIPLKLDKGEWAFLENNSYTAPSYVQMGNVHYPLDTAKLNIGHSDPLYLIRSIKGVLLRFKLGELSIAMSREQLEYTPQTIEAIKTRFTAIVKSITQELEAEWDIINTGTWKEKCEFIDKVNNSKQGFGLSEELLKIGGAKNPKKLYDAISKRWVDTTKYNNDKIVMLKLSPGRPGTISKNEINSTKNIYQQFEKDLVIISGNEKNAYSRVRHAILNGDIVNCYLIYLRKNKGGTQTDIDDAIVHLEKQFGIVEKKSLADFPAPVPTVKAKTVKIKGSRLALFEVQYKENSTSIDQIPVEDRVYQVVEKTSSWGRINKYPMVGDKPQGDCYSFHTHIASLRKVFDIKEPVVVSKNKAVRLAKHGWTEYGEHIKNVMADKKSLAVLAKKIGGYRTPVDDGPIVELVNFKGFLPDGSWDKLKPVLGKYYDMVEAEAKLALKGNETPIILEAYKSINDAYKFDIDLSKFSLTQPTAVPDMPGIDSKILSDIFTHAPNVLNAYLKEVIK